ncbi:hypothetical protein ACFLXN_03245 [Chloroflexota bacterium]
MEDARLYRLEKGDLKSAAEVLARAFGNDPLTRYAFSGGDPDEEALFYFFRIR